MAKLGKQILKYLCKHYSIGLNISAPPHANFGVC